MGHKKAPSIDEAFAVWTGLEPATSCVTGRHSNQLNYQTILLWYYNLPITIGRTTRPSV